MEMAYSNKFAVCVLSNGKIMKELPDGSVGLPFGAEYTLRLFNKHDRRAVAKISLDTENVSGGGFIVEPHSKVDIDRRADRDTAFRFVELGSEAAIEDGKPYTNESREMGLVEVNFHLEIERQKWTIVDHHYHHHYPSFWPHHWIGPPPGTVTYSSTASDIPTTGGRMGRRPKSTSDEIKSCVSNTSSESASYMAQSQAPCEYDQWGSQERSIIVPDVVDKFDGCTVAGNATGTRFRTEYLDIEDHGTLIKLFLQGFKQPVHLKKM